MIEVGYSRRESYSRVNYSGERPSLKFGAVGEWIKAIFAGRVEVERIACVGEPGATWRLTWHESVWEVTCASTWIGAIQGAFPGFSVSLVAFVTKFTFVFVFGSEICYHMLTNVVCVFSTSRRPWSWVVLSRCTNGPLARCGFRGFSPRMCAFLRCSLGVFSLGHFPSLTFLLGFVYRPT